MSVSDVERVEAHAAALGGREKRRYVRRIFSEIAPSYDFLNHLLSFNIDRAWRRRAIAELRVERRPEGLYLDLCAGTLDVSAQLARLPGFRGRIVAADFAEPMLRAGRGKTPASVTHAVAADALELPLANDAAAGALVAFGIRNVADLDAALAEVHRVLEGGARFVILEFATPHSAIVRFVYHLYFHRVLPWIGGLVSGHGSAYRYLPESVQNFPAETELAERMTLAGFAHVRHASLTLGIAALHVGEKPA